MSPFGTERAATKEDLTDAFTEEIMVSEIIKGVENDELVAVPVTDEDGEGAMLLANGLELEIRRSYNEELFTRLATIDDSPNNHLLFFSREEITPEAISENLIELREEQKERSD